MSPEQQARNYDQIAEHWNGPRFNRENGVAQHKRALRLTQTEGPGLDVGCGSSGRIIDLMLEHGLDPEGLDYSSEMLRLARARHPDLAFHHANVCDWRADKQYVFISAWDSIWHVPSEHQEAVLRNLCGLLMPGGVLIFTTGAVDEAGDGSNPFLGQELYHAALGMPAILSLLADCRCIVRHLENDDWPNPHLYIIAQKAR